MSPRWLLPLLLFIGCQRAAPAANEKGPSASVATVAKSAPQPPQTPEEEARFRGETPEDVPLALGPSPAGAPLADREQRLTELLTGQTPAERLPLHDTDPDAPYDFQLYDRLTTEPISGTEPPAALTSSVEVSVGRPTIVAGALDPGRSSRVTAGMRAGFRNCYRRALPEDDHTARKLSFHVLLRVNADGTIESSTIEGKQPAPLARFFDCLKARANASQFEATDKPSQLRFSVDVKSSPAAPPSGRL